MNKYHNRVTFVNGIKFDSIKEANYYVFLKDLEKKGKISNLELQKHYVLVPAVKRTIEVVKQLKTKVKVEVKEKEIQHAIEYIADFVYTDNETGLVEVVDVKSEATRNDKVYRLKKKMMFAFNNIEIQEI